MSTLDETVSMLEVMPEDARMKVYQYVKDLFVSERPANPYTPVSTEQILSDLELSRRQIEEGNYQDMQDALSEMGRKHGFV